MRFWFGALILGGIVCLNVAAEVRKQADGNAGVDKRARAEELVRQLGSSQFPQREKAHKELEAMGLPALEALRKAIMSADLETSRRASDLVRKLEEKEATANLLAPRMVHLHVKDMPALEAVAELSRQSGYGIQVGGDRTLLSQRKVTLNTGRTTFWEAFDQLCAAAGLVEGGPSPGNQPLVPPMPGRQIRIRALPAVPALPVPPPAPPKAIPAPQQGGAAGPGQVFLQVAAAVAPPALQAQDVAPAIRNSAGVPVQAGQILVRAGNPAKVPTYYHGAMRVRLHTMTAPQVPVANGNAGPQEDAWGLQFAVAAEPRLQGVTIVGSPRIDKAIDEHGQILTALMDGPQLPQANAGIAINRLQAARLLQQNAHLFNNNQVRLKKGPKASKLLKEIKGTLTVQALTAKEPILTVENILQAAGRKVEGSDGSSIQVQAVDKQANDIYRLQLHLTMPALANNNPGMGVIQMAGGGVQQIQIQVNGGPMGFVNPNQNTPDLVDAKGQKLQLVSMPSRNLQINNGAVFQTVTMLFRKQNQQGDPDRLVLSGQRTVTVQVPFVFQDVPLP